MLFCSLGRWRATAVKRSPDGSQDSWDLSPRVHKSERRLCAVICPLSSDVLESSALS